MHRIRRASHVQKLCKHVKDTHSKVSQFYFFPKIDQQDLSTKWVVYEGLPDYSCLNPLGWLSCSPCFSLFSLFLALAFTLSRSFARSLTQAHTHTHTRTHTHTHTHTPHTLAHTGPIGGVVKEQYRQCV